MDVRRLEASGDLVGLLRELLRRGLYDQARVLALELIQGGEGWELENAAGEAKPLFSDKEGDWLEGESGCVLVGGVRVPVLWNQLRARLFAWAVATAALPLFEVAYPEDRRPREAIEVMRRYAYGRASQVEYVEAMYGAAQAARAAEVVSQETSAYVDAAYGVARSARAEAFEAWTSAWLEVMTEEKSEVEKIAVEKERTAWKAGRAALVACAGGRSGERAEWGEQAWAVACEANRAGVAYEPPFLRWSLGEVPKFTG